MLQLMAWLTLALFTVAMELFCNSEDSGVAFCTGVRHQLRLCLTTALLLRQAVLQHGIADSITDSTTVTVVNGVRDWCSFSLNLGLALANTINRSII